MKRKNTIAMFTIACIFLSLYASCATVKPMDRVQSLAITVVDAETKAPLPGIKVYRILESYAASDTILFVIPNPETRLNRRIVVADEYETDVNGRVQIDQKSLSLFMNESIYTETLTFNIELNISKVSHVLREKKEKYPTKFHFYIFYLDGYIVDRDKFFRPRNTYRGVNLKSGVADRWPEGFVEQSYYEDIDFLWNEVDWRSESPRRITIELKPYTSEDATIIEQRREERERRLDEEMRKRNTGTSASSE